MTIFPPEPNLEALRLELSRLRAERGWSYDQLAERRGLSRRTLIEIEQGRTIGSLATWHALAHVGRNLSTLSDAGEEFCAERRLPLTSMPTQISNRGCGGG